MSTDIEWLVKLVATVAALLVSATLFFGDMRELPTKVAKLESRVVALELNSATTMAKIESSLSRLENDFNIVKTQIVQQGMKKNLTNR